MFNGAQVTLAGYVATDPIYKENEGRAPKTWMRVAWTARYRDRVTGEWRDGQTSFANVNCWRGLAGNAMASFRKGYPILVTGRLQVREIDNGEGPRRTVVDIEADTIGHDLFRGVGVFSRTQRNPVGRDDVARGEAIRAGLEPDGEGTGGLPPIESAGAPVSHEDLVDSRAIGELAETMGEPTPAAAPF
jgi:single-strand DNA-binding protein